MELWGMNPERWPRQIAQRNLPLSRWQKGPWGCINRAVRLGPQMNYSAFCLHSDAATKSATGCFETVAASTTTPAPATRQRPSNRSRHPRACPCDSEETFDEIHLQRPPAASPQWPSHGPMQDGDGKAQQVVSTSKRRETSSAKGFRSIGSARTYG